jgi:hypothetical protein
MRVFGCSNYCTIILAPETGWSKWAAEIPLKPLYLRPSSDRRGRKRVLLVNKSEHSREVQLPGAGGGQLEYVDETTGVGPPTKVQVSSNPFTMNSCSVAALTLP